MRVKILTTSDLMDQPPSTWRRLGNTKQVDRLMRSMDPNLRYPIIGHFDHGDGVSVRCQIGLADGSTFHLDIPHPLFRQLPEEEVGAEATKF